VDWVIIRLLNGSWAGVNEFGMIFRMKYDWMVGFIYWHEIYMHDNFMLGW